VKDELSEQQIFLIKDIIEKMCEDKEALMPLDQKFNDFVEFC
jgi:hypothetical protein